MYSGMVVCGLAACLARLHSYTHPSSDRTFAWRARERARLMAGELQLQKFRCRFSSQNADRSVQKGFAQSTSGLQLYRLPVTVSQRSL
jgi:hypothetical protein